MTTDLSFITNEGNNKLVNRFSKLLNDTDFFYCLVGYFYSSGFYTLYKSLENTKKIKILIGINTDKKTFDLMQCGINSTISSKSISFKEAKERFLENVINEMDYSEDGVNVEEGIKKFIQWLKSGKLEIRVYPKSKIHAKLYIMGFKEDDRDVGRVITGSSNFTYSGLVDNLEFNVELKNRADYEYALNKFNELWEQSVDVSEEYVNTVNSKTWLNDNITPYELYLKFLYEYLKERINLDLTDNFDNEGYSPESFMDLKYQKDAVLDAKLKVEEYGGVFISDVVGLGKTYITTMLIKQLGGETLVIAPPVLIDEKNPGSWNNAFYDFGISRSRFISRGKLDDAFEYGLENIKNVVIDESHYFRNEYTDIHEKLFRICSGKRVILVSATPLNNKPMDILSQIKLFQNVHNSTLPNPKVRDLEKFFKKLDSRLKGVNRRENKEEYMKIVQQNAKEIRENVLKYLMVRRTRKSIEKYYKKDLEKQGLKFPDVQDPVLVYYEFDKKLNDIFEETLSLIINGLKYSRYTPLLYYTGKAFDNRIIQPQKNIAGFMKTMLLKRLDSSFYAFKQSISRFIKYYEKFIDGYNSGFVYISKKHLVKTLDYLESGDIDKVEKLIEEGKLEKYPVEDFKEELIIDLKNDLKKLKYIDEMWRNVNYDPKINKLIEILNKDNILNNNKIILFTESAETGQYIGDKLKEHGRNDVLVVSGVNTSTGALRKKIIENFDGKSHIKKDEYNILVSTEVLSEGVNLHRSNIVINYDIPWNPSKIMQRVGRINRVDSKFDKIYIYNFFPTTKVNENMGLKEAAEAKIRSFIEMLGNDAKLLTDEEVKSFDLFSRLNSKESIIGGDDEEGDYELEYLTFLRDIRDNNKELYEKIKRIPKKSRTARKYTYNSNNNYNNSINSNNSNNSNNSLITFFKKGKLRKIYITTKDNNNNNTVKELDFYEASKILKCSPNTKKEKINKEYYELLEKNKKGFVKIFEEEPVMSKIKKGRNENKLIKIIKAIIKNERRLTEYNIEYLNNVITLIEIGGVSKNNVKNILNNIERLKKGNINCSNSNNLMFKIYTEIHNGIPSDLFNKLEFKSSANIEGPMEIILSEYLIGGK